MKKFFLILTVLTLAVSCADRSKDPVQESIVAEILDMPQGFTSVSFNSIALIDSTTFGQELERRHKLFETKSALEAKDILKYNNAGKRNNAAAKTESYKKDLLILKQLDSLAVTLADILDDVAYYEYVFSADAKGAGSSMQFRDAYAAVTPDFRTIGLTAKQKDLHKGLGIVIPGYLEIIKGVPEEEE